MSMALCGWVALGLAAVLAGLPGDAGDRYAESPQGWRLLFSGPDDVRDTWGLLHFGATPARKLQDIAAPDFTVVGAFPMAGGEWEVFGQRLTEEGKPEQPWARKAVWRLVRATTRDGAKLDNPTVVYESATAAWTDHFAIARNGSTGEYLALKLKVDESGFAYTAFFSPDGRTWREHAANPLFYDGDAMSLFWSPVLGKFVCINKGLEPYRKRYVDHGGPTPQLRDDSLRDRRVLMMRSSADGRHWTPDVSLSDVWNRHGQKAPIPSKHLTVPDAQDPPDLEFYSGCAFWYVDRAYMMVLNYAATPTMPGKHAPHLDNEWWTSRDGLHWERPARGANALDVFPQVPRLETHPIVLGGRVLFPRGGMLIGLPEDRISFVAARANAEFTTREFRVPPTGLALNAAVPSADRPFAAQQAYVSVAVLDEEGNVVPGFEADRCVLTEMDRRDLPLKWGERSAAELAGRTVRLRFRLRSAAIFAVTAAPGV